MKPLKVTLTLNYVIPVDLSYEEAQRELQRRLLSLFVVCPDFRYALDVWELKFSPEDKTGNLYNQIRET